MLKGVKESKLDDRFSMPLSHHTVIYQAMFILFALW